MNIILNIVTNINIYDRLITDNGYFHISGHNLNILFAIGSSLQDYKAFLGLLFLPMAAKWIPEGLRDWLLTVAEGIGVALPKWCAHFLAEHADNT